MRNVESFNRSLKLSVNPNPLPFFDTTETLKRIAAYEDGYNVSFVGVIENAKLTSSISSLAVAPFPAIYPEDTDSEANAKLLEVEASYPKFCIEFYDYGSDWVFLGKMILQNRNTILHRNILRPYYTRNIAFPFGRTTKLGYRFRDVGSGLPSSNDEFSIILNWREEYHLSYKTSRSFARSETFGFNFPTFDSPSTPISYKIRDYAIGRKAIYITNQSPTYPVFISIGTSAEVDKGVFLAPHGSFSWENTSYDLNLPIYGICNGNAKISGIEFYA